MSDKRRPKIIHFNYAYSCYKFRFKLGQDYTLTSRRWSRKEKGWYLFVRTVRFIKTTRKGFNLLDLKTSKCVLTKTHLYDRKWVGKDIPEGQTCFTVTVPAWLPVPEKVEKAKESS